MSSYYEFDKYKEFRKDIEERPSIGSTIFCIFEIVVGLSPIILLIIAAMYGN